MIKVFTTNKDGKIELTKDELKALLDEAYWEGYGAHGRYELLSQHGIRAGVRTTYGITMDTESV